MLAPQDRLPYKAGDRFGFTWLEFGTIDYTPVSKFHYCEDVNAFVDGETRRLVAGRYGNREYSLKWYHDSGESFLTLLKFLLTSNLYERHRYR